MSRAARTARNPDADGIDADGNNLKETQRDRRWFRYSGDELHGHLMTEVRRLRERQRPRREMYRFNAELYGVSEVLGLGLTNYDAAGVGYVAPTLPFNVVRRGVNTLLSKVAKNRPLPMILTERGNYRQSKRARGLSNFLSGAFTAIKVFDTARELCRDALVFGTGIGRVYHDKGDQLPRIDRILPWEFFTDVADARYGSPKMFYVMRWLDRTVLKELYAKGDNAKDIAQAIEDSGGSSSFIDDMPDYEEEGDMVLVVYAWRLASRDGGTPGKWAIAIDGTTLAEGEYKDHRSPFVFIRYAKPVIGFYGDSLASEMSGFQYEVNYVTETLRMAHRVAATGIWLTDDNTGIPDSYFNNETGLVMKKRPGTSVEHINPDPASPQTYQWLDKCADGALQWSGISTMSANSERPAGITAAKALTTLDDIESDNFALFERDFEQLHLDIADRLIDEFKEMAAANDNLKILVPSKRSLLKVDWKDVDMDRDAIVMQVFPVNLLGRTPAARLQQVNDLFNAGVIDRSMYLKLLDAPDIDSETDLDAAARTIVDEQLEAMLDINDPANDNAYKRPSPYSDLVYAMHRGTQQIALGELQGVPDENLALLRQYVEDAKQTLAQQDKVTPPGGTPAPAAPPGAPPPPMGQIGVAPPAVAPPAPVPGQGTAA